MPRPENITRVLEVVQETSLTAAEYRILEDYINALESVADLRRVEEIAEEVQRLQEAISPAVPGQEHPLWEFKSFEGVDDKVNEWTRSHAREGWQVQSIGMNGYKVWCVVKRRWRP
jgi:hypothetical protein